MNVKVNDFEGDISNLNSAIKNQVVDLSTLVLFVNGAMNESTGAIRYGTSDRLIMEENFKPVHDAIVCIDKTSSSAKSILQFGLYTFTEGTAAPSWSGWKTANIIKFELDASHSYNILVGKTSGAFISSTDISDVNIILDYFAMINASIDAVNKTIDTSIYIVPPFINGIINETTGAINLGTETRLVSSHLFRSLFSQNIIIDSGDTDLSFGLYTFTAGTAAPSWSGWYASTKTIIFGIDVTHTYALLVKKRNDENLTVNNLIGTKIYEDYLYQQVSEFKANYYGVYSKTGTVSESIAVSDSGSLIASFVIPENQNSKCIFNTLNTPSNNDFFYLDLYNSSKGINPLMIKIGNNNEKVLKNLRRNKVYNVEIIWDGVTDSSNKVYSVKLNGRVIDSGTYIGTVSGNLGIHNERSWPCAHLQWLSLIVNGSILKFNNTFDIGKSLLNGTNLSILDFNPDEYMVPKLNSLSRAFHNDETTPSATAPFVLMWCSDIHGDSENTERLKEFYDAYSTWFDDAIHTGDLTTTFAESTTFWESCKKFLNVIGNHEYWGDVVNGSRQMKSPLEVYQKFISPYVSGWSGVVFPSDASTVGKNYYYKDYSEKRIRLIVLDYKEVSYNQSSVQNTWLADILAGTLDSNDSSYGYSVIIAAHAPAFLTEQDYQNPFDSLDIKSNRDGIIPVSFVNTVETFIGNGGKFVCYLTGHNHSDHFGLGVQFTNQLNISVGTASCSKSANTFDIGRTVGTESQDLFNIFAVDTRSEYVKLIRIGSKYDRQLRKREILCYYYGRKVFDSSVAYSIGEIVQKDNTLYQFTSSHNGTWIGTDVCEVNRLIYVG